MKTILILLGFAVLIFVMAGFQIIKTYKEVLKDLKTRKFNRLEYRRFWEVAVYLIPIVGAGFYHAFFIYDPPSTG